MLQIELVLSYSTNLYDAITFIPFQGVLDIVCLCHARAHIHGTMVEVFSG